MANFIDFDLSIIQAGPDKYRTTAQAPDSGQAQGTLDWEALSDEDFLADVELIREEPLDSDNETRFRRVGETLFKALFRDQVYDLFFSIYSTQVQNAKDTYLRVRMDIDEEAPEIAAFPWEFMNRNDLFLATQINTLVTRQLLNLDYGNIQSLAVEGWPKVLVVIPRGSELETAVEEEHIRTALANAGIPFDPAKDILKGRVTVGRLNDVLAANEYNILHFIGHGEFAEGHGSLRFNHEDEAYADNEVEDERWVRDGDLQALLGNYSDYIKLVVLNACKGAEVGEKKSGRGYIGTAPAILKARVPAVIAMQYAIYDHVAIKFAETFYKRLTQGRWAGQVDTALTLARNACLLDFPTDRGFATPILYLRSRDGIIFELPESVKTGSTDGPPPGNGDKPDPCPPPPEPPADILHPYRHDDAESMLPIVKAADETLKGFKGQIAMLKRMQIQNPLQTVMIGMQIEQMQPQVQDMEKEYEEKVAVFRWKLHEACLERVETEAQLADLNAQLAELEAENAYVPYSLKNDVAAAAKKSRELDEVLDKGKELLK